MWQIVKSPLTIAIAAFVVWLVVGKVVLPNVLVHVHADTSFLPADRWLPGRATIPLQTYLDKWARTARHIDVVVVFAIVVLLPFYAGPRFRAWAARVQPPAGESERAAAPFPAARRRARWVIGIVLAGSLACILTQYEVYPFSPYRMYSTVVREKQWRWFEVYGMANGARVDLSSDDYFGVSLWHALRDFEQRDAADRQRRLESLRNRYEQRRAAGLHAGPEIAGLGVNRTVWSLDPSGFDPRTPVERVQIDEIE